MPHAFPSRKLVETLRLSEQPQYRIAWRAGVHPNTLSKLISGQVRARVGDLRLIAVGKELGLSADECFEETKDGGAGERTEATA